MLNLFSFFKQQATDFRADNRQRSADYLAGGSAALREACDALTAIKEVVDADRTAEQLNEAYKESRELRSQNKSFDELRRSFQSRCDLQAKEIASLKERLAKPVNASPVKLKKTNSSLAGEVGSLRRRIVELEQALKDSGTEMPADVKNLRSTIANLRAELDKEKGVTRVGRHVTSLGPVLKALKRVLKSPVSTADERVAYVQRIVDNTEALIEGRIPEDWIDKPVAHTPVPC